MGFTRLADGMAGDRLHPPLRLGWRAVRAIVRPLEPPQVAQLGSCGFEPPHRRLWNRLELRLAFFCALWGRCGGGELRSRLVSPPWGLVIHRAALPLPFPPS